MVEWQKDQPRSYEEAMKCAHLEVSAAFNVTVAPAQASAHRIVGPRENLQVLKVQPVQPLRLMCTQKTLVQAIAEGLHHVYPMAEGPVYAIELIGMDICRICSFHELEKTQ